MFWGMEGFWKSWSKLEMAHLSPTMLPYWVLQQKLPKYIHAFAKIAVLYLNVLISVFSPSTSALLGLPGVFQCAFWNKHISTVSQDHEVRKRSAISFCVSGSFVHWCSSLWEPCLNRCDTDRAGNGSADDEERRVLPVPLRAPVCIWGPGLSSTYSCFFCSFIRGPHPWLPRLGTSWWLYCNESGKKVLREDNKEQCWTISDQH